MPHTGRRRIDSSLSIDHLSTPAGHERPDADIGAIRFQSRPAAVAEQLRNAILRGALKPGERLIEQKLAARFGIGQPTVREALKELEMQGFVRKTSQKHTHVTKLSKEDFREILEVRLALEALAIDRAARNMTPAAIAGIEECADAMESAARRFDLVTFHGNDLLFHRRIWDLAGNEHLGIALERIAFGLFAFVLVQRRDDEGNEFRASADQHKRIVDGLRSGDPKIARQAFLESTVWFWREYHGIEVPAV